MKVGLYNIEPKIENTALMQISHYHKTKGDQVEWYEENLWGYDKVYCSSLFDFTDKSKVPPQAIRGGTGFDLTSKLPFDCNLDYSLYPACDCSYIWFSRGCIRYCGFCVVRDKEGKIKAVTPKNLNPNGKYIKIQDNNFFASPSWPDAIEWLKATGQPVEFAGGLDVRLMDKDKCDAVNTLKHEKQIKIAWDNPKQDLMPKLTELTKYIKGYRLMCYVLIGYNSTVDEDIDRVKKLHKLGITPYAMCIDRNDPEQKRFQKWTNHFFHKTMEFAGFDYNEYVKSKRAANEVPKLLFKQEMI